MCGVRVCVNGCVSLLPNAAMSDGASASAASSASASGSGGVPTYTKVCAGLLDACAHADPSAPRRWRLDVPVCAPARDCTHVWLQARCTGAPAPAARHHTAPLDDGTGAPVLALCAEHDPRFAPGRYLLVLGRLLRSPAFGSAWLIRPHKVVGLRQALSPCCVFVFFFFSHPLFFLSLFLPI